MFGFNLAHPVPFGLVVPNRIGKRGEVSILANQATSCGSILGGQFCIVELAKSAFDKPSPSLELLKVDGTETQSVFRTPVLQRIGKTESEPFKIPMQELTDDNCDQRLRIIIWNHTKEGRKVHGTCDLRFSSFIRRGSTVTAVVDPKGKISGRFQIQNLTIIREPTICDFLRSEVQIDVHVVVDFTSSNKDPMSPLSLHYRHDDKFNPYEACIDSFCSLLTCYNYKSQFAVYGFGGRVRGFEGTSFPLNFDARNPTVRGLDGIMGAYRSALEKVQLAHPTIFTDIVTRVRNQQDERFKSGNFYGVLLILIDDVATDLKVLIDELVEASYQALSIIIIGIGPVDFSAMEKLNRFEEVKSSAGKPMRRKSVIFVPLQKALADAGSKGLKQVTSWALVDIPTQIAQFAKFAEFSVTLLD
jgi:hypothetical protein